MRVTNCFTSIKMGKELFCMHSGIGPATTHAQNTMPQESTQRLIDLMLDTVRILLQLPPVVIGTPVCQLDKIPVCVHFPVFQLAAKLGKKKDPFTQHRFNNLEQQSLYR